MNKIIIYDYHKLNMKLYPVQKQAVMIRFTPTLDDLVIREEAAAIATKMEEKQLLAEYHAALLAQEAAENPSLVSVGISLVILLLLLWVFPSSGVAGVVLDFSLPLCPVQYILHYLYYTSLSTWFSVYL